ncbi:MAG: vitamin K epoxide reductase family protein [Candidatus Aminicenantes bacterium]|jgi:uncharacterized membrane protein|nr:vitamin K epoxide reductase family protein [Candidatus Aminicenantes bacterium]
MNTIKKGQIFPNRVVIAGFTALLLATFILSWIIGSNQRLAILIVILKIVGFAASFLLILGELGHPLFDAICPKWEKIDCHAVMKSPASKLFGLIPMADIGGIYFSGGIILICFSVVNPHFFNQVYLLGILNLLTLPYTIFSLLYQVFVVKYFCFLCLIVQMVFWLEFSQFYSFVFAGFPRFTAADFLPFIWAFGLPLFAWLFFRPLIKKAVAADNKLREKTDQ